MADQFKNFQPGLESPASHLAAVTPSDTQDLPIASRALNVAGAGSIRVTTVKGDTATNVTKAATVQTGRQIQVPLFIKQGENIKIDTRTGEYVERVSKG